MTPSKFSPFVGKKNPSVVPFFNPHVTVPNKEGRHPNTKSYWFQTCKVNPYVNRDTRGSGTLYSTKKGRYFLIELDPNADLCLIKKNFFNVYTNDIDLTNDHQRIFNSTSEKINLNYLIGTYLCFTPHNTQRKGKTPQYLSSYHKNLSQGSYNFAKEVRSTRLGLNYDVIVKRYNEWRGKITPDLKETMEPVTTRNKNGLSTTRNFYKEYSNLEFNTNRTPKQIKRWNRLRKSIINTEEHLYKIKPFLLRENSIVFKKLSHVVERDSSYHKSD
ncbi:unnamed protein product [Rhizophagus irregularis]|nr:unnamed protein product [Rhizophagus irregularis]